ncbi:MAG: tetratricopeptide repeat protein [Gammaproteobacteria bacterium]|nr:tetratricopeptide repeat protein [Gammaproteobacteria bacterium]
MTPHEAIDQLSRALVERPHAPDLHTGLGIAYCQLERYAAALAHYARAVELAPEDAAVHNNLGTVLTELGRPAEAVPHLERAIALHPAYPEALNNLGIALAALGRYTEAARRSRAALKLKPGYAKAIRNLRVIYQNQVPLWHFPMMNDEVRNAAFDDAIRACVKPDSLVLDIGTGSGLLAMMAARAGARRVYTCEMVPLIADKAREIVRRNGLAKTVTVIARKSSELIVGEDLPARADVLITETFDVGLLGEGAVPTIEHARLELLMPQARIVPAGATVSAMLVESESLMRKGSVGEAAGFDLSAFNEYRPVSYQQPVSPGMDCRRLSDDFELFSFDFRGLPIAPAERRIHVRPSSDGTCHGVVYWYRLQIDDERFISTAPGDGPSHWKQTVQLFLPPVQVRGGQMLDLIAAHDRLSLSVQLAREPVRE